MLYDRRWDNPIGFLDAWRQTLLDAANDLERNGWCQNVSYDDDNRACAVGAIGRASQYNPNAYFAAEARFRDFVGMASAKWNDTPGRTQAEVIQAMRACAMEGL